MATVVALTLAACGGGQRQDASEPSANFPVSVLSAQFPTSQRVAGHTELVITVRNAGHAAIPNIAVTICNVSCAWNAPPGEGTSSALFANEQGVSALAHSQIPVWIVDRPPDSHGCGYACASGGAGGASVSDANTWGLGRLPAGGTATFRWSVTALQPGRHVLAWEIGAGLNGNARAVLSGGGTPAGTIPVTIVNTPIKTYVDNAGHIVSKPQ